MNQKIVKIEDNFVTIKNYKEPLLPIEKGKGFGYYGCLLGTPDGDKVMCAWCGKLFSNLAFHVSQAHSISSTAEFIGETGGQRYKHLIFATFGSWLQALKIAKLTPKEYATKYNRLENYDDSVLLEYLSNFARQHNKIPTATDCKRGLLPTYSTYQSRFGTFSRARELAGIDDILK